MKYKSNKKQVVDRMKKANNNVLEAIGKAGEGYVKLLSPVDTGALRDSISYNVDDKSVYVGSTLTSEDYPVIVEKGSNAQAAQPYIHPGINKNLSQLKKIAESNYKL
ncbi:HK97-gp10 family putative phage morphogenesis protein [Virgibacillus sp. CBA3643]|uniref:HK97-gp10 family putative phage morphogenesis protein n=1 Tax=Virgibacillus sp. CBA3643 TaxID=2942278 RepID=UPI0035A35B76